jgi:hypothetical protein
VVSSDKDAGHSEAQLLALFDVEKQGKGDCKIDGLFTEREPCPVCSSLISGRSDVSPGFRTTYLFEWNVGEQDIKLDGIKPPRCPGLIDPGTKPEDVCREIKKATEKPGAKLPPNLSECIDALMKMEAAKKLQRLRDQTDRKLAQLGRKCPKPN